MDTNTTGVYNCMHCDEGGSCSEEIKDTRNPFDPYIDPGADGKEVHSTNCNSEGLECYTDLGTLYIPLRNQGNPSPPSSPPTGQGHSQCTGNCQNPSEPQAKEDESPAKVPAGGTADDAQNKNVAHIPEKKLTNPKKPSEPPKPDDDLDRPKHPDFGHAKPPRPEDRPGEGIDRTGEVGGPKATDGDPVLLSDGSLAVTHTDLSFPGAVHPLKFTRTYSSTSDRRSILGSNWSHNYDVRMIPVLPGNAPSWAPSYCTMSYPQTTCVLLKENDGSEHLFVADQGNEHNLFFPQAGSGQTARRYYDGWMLKAKDGHTRLFNSYGSLIESRDRFGNGFSVTYEPTPVGREFAAHCRLQSMSPAHGEIKEVYVDKQIGSDQRWRQIREIEVKYGQGFDERYCRALATILGFEPLPKVGPEGWATKRVIASKSFDVIKTPVGSVMSNAYLAKSAGNITLASAQRPQVAFRLSDAEYIKGLMNLDATPNVPTGMAHQRPVKVEDDLGRTLNFEYHDDPSDTVQFGLLHWLSVKRIRC